MEGYGQTECTVAVATYPWMKPKPGSMGMPTAGLLILRLLMKMVIHVKQVTRERLLFILKSAADRRYVNGYYRDDKLTASCLGKMAFKKQVIWPGVMKTILLVVGRADDVIKSSGYRIGPFEVESALMEHPCCT